MEQTHKIKDGEEFDETGKRLEMKFHRICNVNLAGGSAIDQLDPEYRLKKTKQNKTLEYVCTGGTESVVSYIKTHKS